jgi:hypothetical protein
MSPTTSTPPSKRARTDGAGPVIYNESLTLLNPVPSDIDIAQAARVLPIKEIAEVLDLQDDELELYGKYKAKVQISARDRLAGKPSGKYICVAGITPTPLGEGKSTTTVNPDSLVAFFDTGMPPLQYTYCMCAR